MKRVFLIVLDSVGIGEMPDAAEFGDRGSNTLQAVSVSKYFSMPNMGKLGLFHIDGAEAAKSQESPLGTFARMAEASKGKDTTIGHWEIAGVISPQPLPTYPHGVGRVIARPFEGTPGEFRRTVRRHDFSLTPPKITMLDQLAAHGKEVLGVGKIYDIFAGKGVTDFVRTSGNADGIDKTLAYMEREFEGLCFVNLVDFDMLYGHRNDVEGYAKALTYFDRRLPEILHKMKEEDILMITADHGCDPSTPSTDHSREYTPLVMYGKKVPAGLNLGTRKTFADIGATVLRYFGIKPEIDGETLLEEF